MLKDVALIPMRGGSKSIPFKNIMPLNGKPLFYWSMKAAIDSGLFDKIFVSTESEKIWSEVQKSGLPVELIKRPDELAQDSTSTEAVMLHFTESMKFKTVTTIQVTSPLTKASDFKTAMELFKKKNLDSLLTGVEFKRFLWSADGKPLNYNPKSRPRRQEMQAQYVENGAFYITKREILETERCRLGGKVGIHVMTPETYFEIDEPEDWKIIEGFLKRDSSR